MSGCRDSVEDVVVVDSIMAAIDVELVLELVDRDVVEDVLFTTRLIWRGK